MDKEIKEAPELIERSDGGNRKYYRIKWPSLGNRTFVAVNMKGHLTIHRSPREKKWGVRYFEHLENLEAMGFEIKADIHGHVNNRYIRFDIPNLKDFIKLHFKYFKDNI